MWILPIILILLFLSVPSAIGQPRPNQPPAQPRRTLAYAQAGSRPLLLDLYLPPKALTPVPVVIYIHGGDWMFGDRSAPPVLFLLDYNLAVASIDYRLAPRNRFPTQIQDCRDALVFLRDDAKRLGIDPSRIGVMGESAGAHLAALLATAPDDKQFVGTRKTPLAPPVQAACCISGPMDIEYLGDLADLAQNSIGRHPIQQLLGGTTDQKRPLARLASPIRHITQNTPPFLLIFGDRDLVVLPILNRDMCAALQAAKIPVQTHEIQGLGHDMIAIWTPEVCQQVATFFHHQLLKSPATTHRTTTQPSTQPQTQPSSQPSQKP